MNYTNDQLLALRPHGCNIICLVMRPRIGKHPKQIGSDESNLITVPTTQNNGTAAQNVSIGLINCQSICIKSDEISDLLRIWILIHSIMHFRFTRKVGKSVLSP